MTTPREQRLFAAARHYLDVGVTASDMRGILKAAKVNNSHSTIWLTGVEAAEAELTAALAAYEGTATTHPDNGSR